MSVRSVSGMDRVARVGEDGALSGFKLPACHLGCGWRLALALAPSASEPGHRRLGRSEGSVAEEGHASLVPPRPTATTDQHHQRQEQGRQAAYTHSQPRRPSRSASPPLWPLHRREMSETPTSPAIAGPSRLPPATPNASAFRRRGSSRRDAEDVELDDIRRYESVSLPRKM